MTVECVSVRIRVNPTHSDLNFEYLEDGKRKHAYKRAEPAIPNTPYYVDRAIMQFKNDLRSRDYVPRKQL